MRANLPPSEYFISRAIPGPRDMIVDEFIDSGNDGLLFRCHSEELGRDLAAKVIPRSNLQHGAEGEELWRSEVHKANALRNPAVVRVEDIVNWDNIPSQAHSSVADTVDCVVLISEFIVGDCLRNFMKQHPEEITVPFIIDWLRTMLNLFYEMDQKNVKHGDLHSGNMLVEDRSSYDFIGPRYVLRVTDFGVGDSTSEPRFKDDYLQLAVVLADLLRKVDSQACGPRDRYFFDILREHYLARHLVETDPTRDPLARKPTELINRLMELDTEYGRSMDAQNKAMRMMTPFDFLSCEQIGEASTLLHALYSDRFLGLAEIESQNNVVVTGPRGCGKSTVFRSLSLGQKTRVGEADPDALAYLGIYYRCDDLYFAFPRYAVPDREDALDIPVHFVTATLLSKLLDLTEDWAREYFTEDFLRGEAEVVAQLRSVLGITAPHLPGSGTFRALSTTLNKERAKAAERQRFVHDRKRQLGVCLSVDVLYKACDVLRDHFAFVRERPFFFFIDDYSMPKVTRGLQENLNRLFMQRIPGCFFKLSTESAVSFVRNDIDGKTYVESREFILHNLGLVYLHTTVASKLAFIEDVFRRRLSNSITDYPASELQDLVGTNATPNNNELARQIRKGEKPYLWGKEIICSLCSGDIHFVIGLVGDMVRVAGGPEQLVKETMEYRLKQRTQDRAIREAAGGFLKSLRSVPKCGDQLVAIVEAFGNIAHSHLRFLDSKNEEGSPPKQATRIEPYQPLSLSENAQLLYNELLRYSVFIEDYRRYCQLLWIA